MTTAPAGEPSLTGGDPGVNLRTGTSRNLMTIGGSILHHRNPVKNALPRYAADLEALVETSPVEVAVFDTERGQAVSVNREARRNPTWILNERGVGYRMAKPGEG